MKNSYLQETSIGLVLILLLVLLLNPFGFWMPDAANMMVLAGLVVVFVLFATFVWKERARDEREALHRTQSSRVAYLIGTAALVVVVAVQSFQHRLDPLLLGALAVMVFGKIAGTIYFSRKF